MKRMLDKEQLIKYNLLTYLEKNRNVSYEELEDELHLSRKTLKKYLLLLTDDLHEFESNAFISPSLHNVTFKYGFEFSAQELMSRFIVSSLRYKILAYALYHSNNNKLNFIRKENISESTYYRLLKDVNETILTSFKIKIDSNLTLIGDEHQIRYFYYTLYNEINLKETSEIDFRYYDEFSPLLSLLENMFNVSLAASNKEQFQLLYHICTARNLQGHKMTITFEMKKITRNNRILELVIEKTELYFERLIGETWKEDLIFFYIISNSFPLFNDTPKIMKLAYDEHVRSKNILYRYIEQFTHSLKKQLPQLELNEQLEGKIIQFYCRILVFDGYLITETGPLHLKYFKKHRPYYLEVLEEVFHELIDFYKTDNDILFIVFHSLMLDNTLDYSKVMPSTSIAIESGADPVLVDFYTRQIRYQISDDYHVVISPYHIDKTYDIVLSDQFNKHPNATFTYRIRIFPDAEQGRRIKGIIKELNVRKIEDSF